MTRGCFRVRGKRSEGLELWLVYLGVVDERVLGLIYDTPLIVYIGIDILFGRLVQMSRLFVAAVVGLLVHDVFSAENAVVINTCAYTPYSIPL